MNHCHLHIRGAEQPAAHQPASAYSDAAPGPGRCNIMAHLCFILTSRSSNRVSLTRLVFHSVILLLLSPTSLLSRALFPRFFSFNLILTFAIFQRVETQRLLLLLLGHGMCPVPLAASLTVCNSGDLAGNRTFSSL